MSYSAEYELRRVARWRGFDWEQFDLLDVDEQAAYVAEYRTEHRLQSVEHYDRKEQPHARSRGRPARSRRRR